VTAAPGATSAGGGRAPGPRRPRPAAHRARYPGLVGIGVPHPDVRRQHEVPSSEQRAADVAHEGEGSPRAMPLPARELVLGDAEGPRVRLEEPAQGGPPFHGARARRRIAPGGECVGGRDRADGRSLDTERQPRSPAEQGADGPRRLPRAEQLEGAGVGEGRVGPRRRGDEERIGAQRLRRSPRWNHGVDAAGDRPKPAGADGLGRPRRQGGGADLRAERVGELLPREDGMGGEEAMQFT